jgi:hypothetical protein
MTSFQRWPFLPLSAHTGEQRALWWQDCYVATPEMVRFVEAETSAILVGGPGSGKSTAVAALQKSQGKSALLLPYPPYHWPNGSRPWVPGGNHLSQILAAAATEITRILTEKPEAYAVICQQPHTQQFLFWLIEAYLGQRTLSRLLHRLRQSLSQHTSLETSADTLYETTTHEADVWNQLDELVYLIEALQFSRLILTIDLNEAEAYAHLDDLRDLFGWLDLFEYPEFALQAAIPQSVDALLKLTEQVNGRSEIIYLRQDNTGIQDIVSRYLVVATNGVHRTLTELTTAAVLARAQEEIQHLYGRSALSGWLQWAETLIVSADSPTSLRDPDEATCNFYQRHVPLRLDTSQFGVWRGPQFITLDQQPYEFLRKLFELRGRPSPDLLQDFAGSGANLNTLASRLRKQIEPLPNKNIYLQNRRDRGYWLENFAL